jgi:hypothetical protein
MIVYTKTYTNYLVYAKSKFQRMQIVLSKFGHIQSKITG